ncbi:hypothetical protein HELRODRAFT_188517 [Helobdella robusta]|uniref:Uncharacterized protein n=1 Tax=Helobdella robusta TaxID=6412 RepID=T1FQ31_HELRO|nr:hypothetical protein HELRODRAFT_188517 [Helobdella robusta]ESO01903.1 hypothetical protein HELRODRAFT_188517 [Helobdella robusta]
MSIRSCLLCTKYSVFFLNFMIWMSGLIILGLAIYLRMDPTFNNIAMVGYTHHNATFHIFCYFLVFFGSIVTFLGFLGCCSSYQESFSMLGLFVSVLILFLIAEVGMASWLIMQRNGMKTSVSETMQKYITDHYGDDIFTDDPIDHLQDSFRCCGSIGPADYQSSRWLNNTSHHVHNKHEHHRQHQHSKHRSILPHSLQHHVQPPSVDQYTRHEHHHHHQQQQQHFVPISCCGLYNLRKKVTQTCLVATTAASEVVNKNENAADNVKDGFSGNNADNIISSSINNNNSSDKFSHKLGKEENKTKINNRIKSNNSVVQAHKKGCSEGITSFVDRTIEASCIVALVITGPDLGDVSVSLLQSPEAVGRRIQILKSFPSTRFSSLIY